jgi:hypothetical protein
LAGSRAARCSSCSAWGSSPITRPSSRHSIHTTCPRPTPSLPDRRDRARWRTAPAAAAEMPSHTKCKGEVPCVQRT